MKLSIATLLVLPALAAAFVPVQPRAFGTALSITKEEDLEMTREVILKGLGAQASEPAKEEESTEAEGKEE